MKVWDPEKRQVVDVPAAEVAATVGSGKYGLLKDVRYLARDPNGALGTVPGAQLLDALGKGYRLADDDELYQERAKEEQGRAFMESALRGVSLGLSDVLLTKALDVDPKAVAARQAEFPAQDIATQTIAGLAATIASGGTTLPAQAARLAPIAATARIGAAAERAAALALGKHTSATLARAGSRAVAGVTEGALMGAGYLASEASISDKELAAEEMLGSLGMGAFLGGSLSVVGGAVLDKVLKKGDAAAYDELLKTATGNPNASGGAKYSEFSKRVKELSRLALEGPRAKWDRTKAELGLLFSGVTRKEENLKFMETLLSKSPEGEALRANIANLPDIVDGVKERLHGVLQGTLDDVAEIQRLEFGRLRPEALDRLIAKDVSVVPGLLEFAKHADEVGLMYAKSLEVAGAKPSKRVKDYYLNVKATERSALKMLGDPTVEYVRFTEAGTPIVTERALTLTEAMERVVQGDIVPPEGAARAMFDELQLLKSRNAALGTKAKPGSPDSEFLGDILARTNQLRGIMRNGELWGADAAELSALQDRVYAIDAASELSRRWQAVDGSVPSSTVHTYVEQYSKFSAGDQKRALDTLFASLDEHQALAKFYKKDILSGLNKLHRHKVQYKAVSQDLDNVISTRNSIKMLMDAENTRWGAGLLFSGAGAGFVLGGVKGALIGALATPFFRASRYAAGLGSREAAKNAFYAAVQRRAARFAGAAATPEVASAFLQRRVAATTQAILTARTHSEREKAFRERIQELEDTQFSGGAQRVMAAAGNVVTATFPETSRHVGTKLSNAVDTLMQVRPRTHEVEGLVDRPKAVSSHDMHRFAQIDKAVQDPLSIMDALEEERLTPAMVAAVARTHPRLLQTMQQTTVEEVTRNGKPLSYRRRLQLQVLTGKPMHPTANPTAVALQQQVYQAGTEVKAAGQAQTAPRAEGAINELEKAEDAALVEQGLQ